MSASGEPTGATPMNPPVPRPPPPAAGPAIKPESTPVGPLPLPHELDQSLGSTVTEPDPVIQQAARDIEAGLVDTDLHGTPGMGAEEQQRLLEQSRKESEAASPGRPGKTPKPR